MSPGPNKPKPDYENMWKNYSGWVDEASSVYGSRSSLTKAKAAASGVTGVTPKTQQAGLTSDYEKELRSLRGGVTGSELKSFAHRMHRVQLWQGQVDPESEIFGWSEEQFQTISAKYEKVLGATPEPWEAFLFDKYGYKATKFTDKELSVFKAEEAGGKTSKGLLAKLDPANAESKSPWV